MTRKRKDNRKPQKMTKFYPYQQGGGKQDGAGTSSTPAHDARSPPSSATSRSTTKSSARSPQSCPNTPQSARPAKARFRLDDPGCSPVTGPEGESEEEDTRELPARIEKFPTTNQPVLDTVLKDMLLSLCSTIQTDMVKCMQKFHTDIQEVKARVDHIECKKWGNLHPLLMI